MSNISNRKLDHVAFLVGDLGESISFYRDKLGFKLLFKEEDLEHGEAFAFLELDGGNLELLQKIPKKPLIKKEDPKDRANCPHIALISDDVNKELGELEKAGVKIIGGPYKIEDKVIWGYIADPDDNIIEYVQWLN